MMAQRTIFDEPDESKALARRDDPATSKAAAVHAAENLGALQSRVLAIVSGNPSHTAQELADIAEVRDPRTINRRLGELERKGLLTRTDPRECTVTGRMAATWEVA